PSTRVTSWEESASRVEEILRPLVNKSRKCSNNKFLSMRPFFPSRYRQAAKKALAAFLPRRRLLVHGPAQSSAVCLTFDDGPDPTYTPAVLDVLKSHAVSATFFVIGQKAERHPDLIRRMAAEGHVIGNHTYSHSDPEKTSAHDLIAEVGRTSDILRR